MDRTATSSQEAVRKGGLQHEKRQCWGCSTEPPIPAVCGSLLGLPGLTLILRSSPLDLQPAGQQSLRRRRKSRSFPVRDSGRL